MATEKNFIGIDLGTSNSAVAVIKNAGPEIVSISQKVSPNSLAELETLPSVILLGDEEGSHEFGTWAKEKGAESPERLISSAKSWLCHGGLGRMELTLPYQSQVPHKLSPVDASSAILSYLKDNIKGPWQGLTDCELVITVPASFDELARNLTIEAAHKAKLPSFTLLEEPLAAMYSWIAHHEKDVPDHLEVGDLILVCDMGGGTTDFTLVAVGEDHGQIKLERVSVGPHLLLGGDNIDLTLAYHVRQDLEEDGQSLDEWQFRSLIYQCQKAKETLLASDQEIFHFSIPSLGSDLFGGTISASISRDRVTAIVLDGFFPLVSAGEHPVQKEADFQEFGLPYAKDPTITRHLAQFLSQASANLPEHPLKELLESRYSLEQKLLKPSHILFNGGTASSPQIRERILDCAQTWVDAEIKILDTNYSSAVALGAAYYGRLKATQEGIRIKSGTSKSFYIEVESAQMPIPGFTPPKKAICIVPQGTEEGDTLSLENKVFSLSPGSKVTFRFYASRFRPQDQCGSEVANAPHVLEDLIPMVVDFQRNEAESSPVPVTLGARLSELGTLELYFENQAQDQKWDLTIDVR